MFDDIRQDFRRYSRGRGFEWYEVSLWAVAAYRFGQWAKRIRLRPLRGLLMAMHLLMHIPVTILTGIQIPRGATIGPGLRIFHFGGIVVNSNAIIGKNVTLRHNVCIGNRHSERDVPRIGDNVEIGVGAVVMGSISIGNRVHIGANAVVLCDVPADHTAVGVPAVLRRRTHDKVSEMDL